MGDSKAIREIEFEQHRCSTCAHYRAKGMTCTRERLHRGTAPEWSCEHWTEQKGI